MTSAQEWMARVRAWAATFPQRRYPIDDSRESIYATEETTMTSDRDRRIKREIAAGTYETPAKLAIAFERAMAAVVGPNDVDGGPLLRLGPGGDFTRDVYADELFPSTPSSERSGGGASEGGAG